MTENSTQTSEPQSTQNHETVVEHWTVDKRIPIAVIAAFVGQLVLFGWQAAKMDSRIEMLERLQTMHSTRENDAVRENRMILDKLIRLEEKWTSVDNVIQRLEDRLERK